MNLLMIAPLLDSRGELRYYIGAQVDVSGLVKESTNLEGLQHMLQKEEEPNAHVEPKTGHEFGELCEMFSTTELEAVRKNGGRMHTEIDPEPDERKMSYHRPRLLLKENVPDLNASFHLDGKIPGKLAGIYQHVSSPVPLFHGHKTSLFLK
jgi:hypothetical protein